jgi:hypothetical protein
VRRNYAASVLVVAAASAAAMVMATPTFASGGLPMRTLSGSLAASGTGESARAFVAGPATVAIPLRCWHDHDRDDRTGRPSDHDRDEAAHCRF